VSSKGTWPLPRGSPKRLGLGKKKRGGGSQEWCACARREGGGRHTTQGKYAVATVVSPGRSRKEAVEKMDLVLCFLGIKGNQGNSESLRSYVIAGASKTACGGKQCLRGEPGSGRRTCRTSRESKGEREEQLVFDFFQEQPRREFLATPPRRTSDMGGKPKSRFMAREETDASMSKARNDWDLRDRKPEDRFAGE